MKYLSKTDVLAAVKESAINIVKRNFDSCVTRYYVHDKREEDIDYFLNQIEIIDELIEKIVEKL
jgi:hypothetical protein